jgi:hypothetical protein
VGYDIFGFPKLLRRVIGGHLFFQVVYDIVVCNNLIGLGAFHSHEKLHSLGFYFESHFMLYNLLDDFCSESLPFLVRRRKICTVYNIFWLNSDHRGTTGTIL